jgi:AbrB family transcriptional regulator, stage V sporulation protein T
VKSTGVLRRIDDLGRIVIPKEIRKHLRIRDGEYLEIFTENENLILKKHSIIDAINTVAQICVDSANDVINANVIVTDRDKVIAVSGPLKKKYLDKSINSKLLDLILGRKSIVITNDETIRIDNENEERGQFAIIPIISNGDAIGLTMVLLTNRELSVVDEKVANFISNFLGKHME